MNKNFFTGFAGAIALALLLHPGVFAQSSGSQKPENQGPGDNPGRMGKPNDPDRGGPSDDPDRLGEYDEIIIKRKDDKNAKVIIEIRDNQVFVDGKPVSQYENDTLSVRKKRIRLIEAPGLAGGPFHGRGGVWSYGGESMPSGAKPALLGVFSEKNDTLSANGGGAKIREITPGSAAEKAGLRKGDVITRADDINIENPENLYNAIRKYRPRDKVTLSYRRDGREEKVTVALGEGKTRPGQPYLFNFPDIGNPDRENFEWRNLPVPPNVPGELYVPGGPGPFSSMREEGRPRLGIHAQDTEDGKGVKVLEVDGGSSADKAGIKEGDIITRFDGREVNSAGSLAEIARAGSGKMSVKISLIRNGAVRELEVKVPRKLKTADL